MWQHNLHPTPRGGSREVAGRIPTHTDKERFVAVPEQIRRQSEAIAKMYEESAAKGAADEAVTQEAGAPASVEADSGDNAAPVPPPVEQRRVGTSDSEETYEKRYKSLQGMYNADTARLRADNQQLNGRVTQLEQLLASLSAAPQPSAPTVEKLVTEKDVEEYGDSIEVMRRVTREEVSAANRRIAELEHMLKQVQTSVLPRVEQVAQRQAVTAEQSFWSELSAAVPAWRDINADQNFHKWLLDTDPLTGLTRQTYLEDAQRNLDVRRVAAFFTSWQGLNGQSTAQPSRSASDSQLDKQVAPGRSRGGSAPASAASKTYSSKDIAKFFDDVRKGVYRGKEAERDRIERDIFAAQRENRIVANG